MKHFFKKRILFFLAIISFVYNNSFCQNSHQDTNNQPALTDYIDIYQKYISSIKGSNCQMQPSCSNYGMGAFKAYNPFKASFLTADRLLRCSHDIKHYNNILTSNGVRLVDFPVNTILEEEKLLRSKSNIVLFCALDTTASGAFINHLISKKHYREALLELNRLIYFNSDKVHETQYLNYLVCKRALNELEDAIFTYENTFPKKIKANPIIINEIGNINLTLGNYDRALIYFNNCISSTNNPVLQQKSTLMKGLLYAKQKKWNESQNTFASLPDNSIYAHSKTNCLQILENRKSIVYKKPHVAGVLSIIPGLGYLYTGHKQTAISSLVINGLLAYATYTNLKNENYGMTALTGLFSFSFYVGNITGSVKSAKRFNYKKEFNVINRLKSNIYY